MSDNDEHLAIRCQLGEPAALDALIARWHPGLWRYARRVTGTDDAADDVVQDSWLRIVRGLPRLREPARIRAWIFGITRRVLMDRLRSQYAAPLEPDTAMEDVAAPTADPREVELETDIELMTRTLDRLPVIERDVLALFYLDELTLADIATAMDVPVGTVKSRLFRARRLLRARIEESSS